jgi:hypothetical protein
VTRIAVLGDRDHAQVTHRELDAPLARLLADWILNHDERIDGTRLPDGLCATRSRSSRA